MEIVGISRKSGEYEGRPYDKLKLHCKGAFETDKDVAGEMVEVYSLNFKDCENLLKHCQGHLSSLLGTDVKILYNKYGKAEQAIIVSKEK